ncbi:hypothetical protein D0X99_16840 [Algoriphagus lacus]|uniref:Uncharacterized protein n=1 Tax=Algoriphagus lacus TaxID=2056311 RepID=A0A418PNN5_9BACT|nr:hypothetical protein [Algoriphagus lacus]RIW13437.1 hypothetical protein D0X99_16840 [Algoriphagus lacus]
MRLGLQIPPSPVDDLITPRQELVFLDDRNRAINEDAFLKAVKWHFAEAGPNGGCADNIPRLAIYVRKLKAGRWWEG